MFLIQYLIIWQPLGYILTFLGMIFEGETVLFIAAFLTHLGIFNPYILFLIAFWGVILGDNLWFSLGKKMRNSSTLLNKWSGKIAQPFDEHLLNKPLRTIFIAKFTLGIGHAIFFRAGALKMKWAKIEQYDILATLFWMVIIGSIGYFSSASLSYLKQYLRYGEVALLIGLILFLALQHFIAKQSQKKL